jgi:drug/metabolite transporter (DMT)-like permease
MLYVLVLYAIFAATFILIKDAMIQTTALFLIAFRMIYGGLLLLGYQYFFHRDQCKIEKKDLWLFFKTAFFMIFFAFVTDAYSLKFLPSIKANLLWSAQPFISAFLAYILLHEILGFKKIVGLAFGVIGTGVIFMAQEGSSAIPLSELLSFSGPEMIIIMSATSTAYGWFLVKELLDRKYPMVFINGIMMLFGGLMSLVTYFACEGFAAPFYTGPFMRLFWLVSALVFGSNIIAYNLYGMLLKRFSITFLTFAGFTCPIFGAFFGWMRYGEIISWHYIAALALIIFGLYLFYKEETEGKSKE